jgi:hypothetical protein
MINKLFPKEKKIFKRKRNKGMAKLLAPNPQFGKTGVAKVPNYLISTQFLFILGLNRKYKR